MSAAKIKIFLSHKVKKDHATALIIKKELESVVKDKVDVFLSENINKGGRWEEILRDKLNESSVLIFLYTDPSENWDWCHYETGLFTDLNDSNNRKIICLHSKRIELPAPFKSLQDVKADKDDHKDVLQFLEELFVGADPIRSEWWVQNIDRMKGVAAKIVLAVENAVIHKRDLVSESLTLIVNKDKKKLSESTVVEIDDSSLDILFKKRSEDDGGCTWGEIKKAAGNLNPNNQDWTIKVEEAIASYMARNPISKISNLHFGKKEGEIYILSFFRIETIGSGAKKFHLLFIKQPAFEAKEKLVAINSFEVLLEQLTVLIETASDTDVIKFLAYTPSIGYIAKKDEAWNKLKEKLLQKIDNLEIICLAKLGDGNIEDKESLQYWHSLFKDRITDRGVITTTITDLASDEAEKIIDKMKENNLHLNIHRLPFSEMPDYYLFKHTTYAICIVPFFLPPLDYQPNELPNVEMAGLATNNINIINNVETMFQYFTSKK